MRGSAALGVTRLVGTRGMDRHATHKGVTRVREELHDRAPMNLRRSLRVSSRDGSFSLGRATFSEVTNSDVRGRFGPLGVWLLRSLATDKLRTIAREVEGLGYGAIWVSGGREPGVFDVVETVLEATERIPVATGIVNLWVETPESVTEAWHRLEARFPGRLYVGLGISHAPMVEGVLGLEYSKPLARTREFLDGLDARPDPLPVDRRLIGALGPKMLQLSAARTLGAHPYLVTTRNTEQARGEVGDAVVAAELGVVLEPDVAVARATARSQIARYFEMPNYTNNWLRSGFTEADLAGGGSDALIEALIALGGVDAVAARVAEHRAAGADHIALQVLGDDPDYVAVFTALAGV
jgi:probable F420-dependent oxidoreductase